MWMKRVRNREIENPGNRKLRDRKK